jgi:hypothetical protein
MSDGYPDIPPDSGEGRPAGPGAEGMDPDRELGDRPLPPDPNAPGTGVIDEGKEPPEPNEPA